MEKTQEELTQLKTEYETLNNKLKELTEDELKIVTGGFAFDPFEKLEGRYIGLRRELESEAGEFIADAYKGIVASEPGGGKTVCG